MLMLRGIEGMTVRGIDNANGRESPGDARAWARGNKRKGNEWRVCIASKRRRCAYGLEGGSVDVDVNGLGVRRYWVGGGRSHEKMGVGSGA